MKNIIRAGLQVVRQETWPRREVRSVVYEPQTRPCMDELWSTIDNIGSADDSPASLPFSQMQVIVIYLWFDHQRFLQHEHMGNSLSTTISLSWSVYSNSHIIEELVYYLQMDTVSKLFLLDCFSPTQCTKPFLLYAYYHAVLFTLHKSN